MKEQQRSLPPLQDASRDAPDKDPPSAAPVCRPRGKSEAFLKRLDCFPHGTTFMDTLLMPRTTLSYVSYDGRVAIALRSDRHGDEGGYYYFSYCFNGSYFFSYSFTSSYLFNFLARRATGFRFRACQLAPFVTGLKNPN